MNKIHDEKWRNLMAESRKAWIQYFLLASALFIVLSLSNESEASEDAQRRWRGAIFYELHECPSASNAWMDTFERILDEISPHTVEFVKSPSSASTNLLVKCSVDNWLNNSLVYTEEGEAYSHDKAFTMGVTRSRYYKQTGYMMRADIWLNQSWIWNDEQLIRHELGHALGITDHLDDECEENCPETLMNAFPSIGYWDIQTLSILTERYERKYPVVDDGGKRYIPCQWVSHEIAAMHGIRGAFYWAIESNNQGLWEVIEFGLAKDCN